jgi:hypothetical protein
MAVKVMLAPSLAKRDEDPLSRSTRANGAEAKPRRRRSAVYDADGNEVFITLICLKCRKGRPLAQFGLRKMADGAIRNQPWCRTCRSAAGTDAPKRKARSGADEVTEGAADVGEKQLDAGVLAAQVVAALHGGRR